MVEVLAPKAGIDHLKALLGFILDLVSAVMEAIAEGKFGLSLAFKLLGLIKEAVTAFKDIAMVKDEIKDLDDTEKQQLVDMVEQRLKISSPAIKGYVEKGLEALLALISLYGSFVK